MRLLINKGKQYCVQAITHDLNISVLYYNILKFKLKHFSMFTKNKTATHKIPLVLNRLRQTRIGSKYFCFSFAFEY